MASHTRFKLAVIRTMRCDYCNKSNVDGLQECVDCNMHICRECVETGKLDNDEKHRMQQDIINNLDWKKAPRGRRTSHHKSTSISDSSSSPAAPPKHERRQAKADRQLQDQSDHDTGSYFQSDPRFRSIMPRPPPNVDVFSGGGFNISAGNHEHTGDVHGHGHFQFGSARPGYPPGLSGYNSSFPTHVMPPGMQSFVPGQPGQPGQPPNQGGLAMPMGPVLGHHFSVNPGIPSHGDPRLNTPPGPQFAHSGYSAPNNFGGFRGGQPLAFSPAPTPPGFAGPGFHQHTPLPPAMYNDRGYVPHGNMPPGQPLPGPFPSTGQPYGGGPFPHAPQPPQEQGRSLGQAGGPSVHNGQIPYLAQLAREFHARYPPPRGHAEQSASTLNKEQKQSEPKTLERGQYSQPLYEALFGVNENTRQPWPRTPPVLEPSRSGPSGYGGQVPLNSQSEAEVARLLPYAQRALQDLVQQHQRQVRGQHESQPAVQKTNQTAQQAQNQNEKREQKTGEQQVNLEASRAIPEGTAVRGPPPVTSSLAEASPITLPPIITPPVIISSVQEEQTPDSAPDPPLHTLEPDPNAELSRLQFGEAYATTPNVVGHAQRPFGIPALTRDLFQGRPNHYDETAARWEQLARARRSSPDDDFSDETVSETGDNIGKGKGKEPARPSPPSDQLPGRGRKRTFSQASSAEDSTLSAELLDQPFTPATTNFVLPGTEALRRNLRDDATIARARREDGERAALDMAAAANTLHGGGRGLGGVADAQVVANDREIGRRQDDIDGNDTGPRHGSVELLKEVAKHQPGSDGARGSSSGTRRSARDRAI